MIIYVSQHTIGHSLLSVLHPGGRDSRCGVFFLLCLVQTNTEDSVWGSLVLVPPGSDAQFHLNKKAGQ